MFSRRPHRFALIGLPPSLDIIFIVIEGFKVSWRNPVEIEVEKKGCWGSDSVINLLYLLMELKDGTVNWRDTLDSPLSLPKYLSSITIDDGPSR